MGDLSQVVYAVGRHSATGVRLLGTAFAVSATKVATALHVAGADDRDLVLIKPRISNLSDYQDTSDASVDMIRLTMSAADPVRDLCVLDLQDARIRMSYVLGSTDDVSVGAPVATLGFPHAPTGRFVLTQHQVHVGARILIENRGQKTKHLVLNTQAREGQSGGPVVDQLAGSVVGVVLGSYAPGGGGGISLGGIDPQTLHQTTHAISAEYLRSML